HLLAVSTANNSVDVISLDTGDTQTILAGEQSPAKFAEPGYLLFMHGDSLLAQPFEPKTLRTTGPAQHIAEGVFNGPNSFSTSSSGLLLYQRSLPAQLMWLEADGSKVSTLGSPNFVSSPYVSPDGKYVLASVNDSRQNRLKLWLYDVASGTSNPFT